MVYALLFILIMFHLSNSRFMQRIYRVEKQGFESMERQQERLASLKETSDSLRSDINGLECRLAHVEEDLRAITPLPTEISKPPSDHPPS